MRHNACSSQAARLRGLQGGLLASASVATPLLAAVPAAGVHRAAGRHRRRRAARERDGGAVVTVLAAMADQALFGAAFPHTESWAAWRAFLAACFGLGMTDE